MSFAPSSRGETKCTSASQASAIGGTSGGVSTTAPTTAAAVASSGGGVATRSPMHPSRTMVQRVNTSNTSNGGRSSPSTPVPRGCSASSCNIVATTTASPVATVLTPHRPFPSATTTNGPPQEGGSNKNSNGPQNNVVLPPLTRTNPSRTSQGDLRAIALSSAAAVPRASFSVELPPIAQTHMTSSVIDADEKRRKGGKANSPNKESTQPSEPQTSPSTSSAATPSASTMCLSAAAAATRNLPSSTPVNENAIRKSGYAVPQSRSTGEPYFRDNKIPNLFNQLSEALLEARPEDPVAFMTEWLRRRRDALRWL